MGIFSRLGQPPTDQESVQDPPKGFFATRMGLGGRQAARQQEFISNTLNDEIAAAIGDSNDVNLQEVLPEAYFNAARKIAALGNSTEAQKLYNAGLTAVQTTAAHAANLAHLKAQTSDLDEAPTEALETIRQRDALAERAQQFGEDTPTGAALRRRVAELDERLTVLNERGVNAGAIPREIQLATQMTRERAAAGDNTPVTTEEVWRTERMTSQRTQDYRQYVEDGGKEPYDKWILKFEGNRSANQEAPQLDLKGLFEDEGTAQAAVASLNSIKTSLDLVNEGVRTGTAAGLRQSVARAAATFLGDDPSTATVNTDAYIASSAPRVVQIVRALAPVTDQDKEYIQAAVGGALNVATPEAMRKLLEIAARSQTRNIEKYNARLARLGDQYEEVNLPAPIEAPVINFAPPAARKAITEMTDAELEAELNGITSGNAGR